MPSLRQLYDLAPVAAQVVGGVVQRRGTGQAVNRLQEGAATATDTINRGADASRRTMTDVYGQQQRRLAPYNAAGESTLPGLTAGVAPGGEFNKPFSMADFELYRDPMFNYRVEQGQRRIKAAGNAGGTRFSTATMKALAQNVVDETRADEIGAYGRYQDDLAGRFNRVSSVEGIGERAAGAEVNAGAQYGANLSRLEQSTAQQLSELQTDLASAQAAGDIKKASTITDTITGVLGTMENSSTAKSMAKLLGFGSSAIPAAQVAAGVSGTVGLAGGAAGAGLASAPAALGGLPASAALFGGGAPTGIGATLGLGGSPGFLGVGAATIPVIGAVVAGAVIGAGLWKKAQTSAKADKWVEVQRPFDEQMASIDRAATSGQLPPAEVAQSKKAVVTDYLAAAMEFARKGKDHATVIRQAMDTFRRYYPQFAGGVA